MKKLNFFFIISAFLLMPLMTKAALNPQVDKFTERTYAGWDQLVVCPDSPAVYYIGPDAKRYVFPNSKTFFTYYPDFSNVMNVSCTDLSQFPLAGTVTYNPGTRYVKFQSLNTVYAVEPGGVLRAIPNEQWMETFVGDDWNKQIDDVSDSFYGTYTMGEPLALMEIPDGMTAKDPTTGIWYYFVDGQPKSLEGISFAFLDNGHFRNYTRTKEQAPRFYERVEPTLKEGTRIGSDFESKLGTPWFWDSNSVWIEQDNFPLMKLKATSELLSYSLGNLPVSVNKTEAVFDYSAQQLKDMADECGVNKALPYYEQLIETFKGAKKITYTFSYNAPSQDDSIYKVTLIENAVDYGSLDAFKEDFDICAAGGEAYPKMLNQNWLMLTSACGSGADDGSGLPHGCYEIRNQVEPTLKIN